jgi:hypothetical protein
MAIPTEDISREAVPLAAIPIEAISREAARTCTAVRVAHTTPRAAHIARLEEVTAPHARASGRLVAAEAVAAAIPAVVTPAAAATTKPNISRADWRAAGLAHRGRGASGPSVM